MSIYSSFIFINFFFKFKFLNENKKKKKNFRAATEYGLHKASP